MDTLIKIIIYAFLLLNIKACYNDKEVKKSENCSFNKLYSSDIETVTATGNTMVLSGKIMANIKRLSGIRGELEVLDTLFLNRVDRKITNKESYSDDFLGTHNAIVQILCSLESEMIDTALDISRKSKIQLNFDNKRDEYFNYLLGTNEKSPVKYEIQKKRSLKKENAKIKQRNFELSIYVNENMFHLKSLKINGQTPKLNSKSSGSKDIVINILKKDSTECTTNYTADDENKITKIIINDC